MLKSDIGFFTHTPTKTMDVRELNVRSETRKSLEEKFCGVGLGNNFFLMIPKASETKAKLDNRIKLI